MPVKPVYKKGRKVGYRWGKYGKLYTCKEEGSCENAKRKAQEQARAIYASGWREQR